MPTNVRVRYAPSPTGDPHVGNIRTAIFNWLFARHSGGTFAIRVEDTDQTRKVEGATETLLETLRWLGVDWDEGPDIGGRFEPYYQSQRLELYHRASAELLEGDTAYRCYCSPQRLSELREEQARLKKDPGYDKRCRDLTDAERFEWEKGKVVPVIRFKMPMEGVTTVDDLVRGKVSFENRLADDFVLVKSDGYPTYHLANVVDDHLMEITHVLRAEEWLPSTPRHLQLYDVLGWEPPLFAHLPMILATDKSKLSKREGAASTLEYRQNGYVPEAMVNFLTLLGWSLDDKTDVIAMRDLIQHFSIERIGKSGAVFDSDKLAWMNGHYIRQMSHGELADTLLDHWVRYPPEEVPEIPERAYLLRIVPMIQERLKTLSDAAPLIAFFFVDGVDYEAAELVQKGMDDALTLGALEAALAGLSELSPFDARSLEGLLRPMAEELEVKAGQLFGSIRVATTGLRVAPPLFDTLEVLGKERTLSAIQKAIDKL